MSPQDIFIFLLKAGLWEKEVKLSPSETIEFWAIYQLAQEQSVVGLIAAGLEHVVGVNIQQKEKLTIVGSALQIERRNTKMNAFIAELVEKFRKNNISSLLLKGQGVAQCYERPLWRSCGDVDLFLNDANYVSAKNFLLPLASNVETEGVFSKHLGLMINSWNVELHGTLRCGLSRRIDKMLDKIIQEKSYESDGRLWKNNDILVLLPNADNDAVYIFTHLLSHFYKGGIGLRQLCDWCRLLWTYRMTINYDLLEKRLLSMGLMTEWKAFGAFAVEYLGMPCESMPFYSSNAKWKRKSRGIWGFIIKVGNFGHNRDMSYFESKPYMIRKAISFKRRCCDFFRHMQLFPIDSLRFFPWVVFYGIRSAMKGE